MNAFAGPQRSRQISSLYVMTKAVVVDGLSRGFRPASVQAAAATFCYCMRGDLDVLTAHEVLQAATYMGGREWSRHPQ